MKKVHYVAAASPQKSQFPELIFTEVFQIYQFLEFNPTVVDDPPETMTHPRELCNYRINFVSRA